MPTTKRKTLADFKAIHDPGVVIPTKLRAALAKLEKEGGPDAWEYEMDFMRMAGVSSTHLGLFREQFSNHVVEVRAGNNTKRVWVATAKAATKFRTAP